MKLEYSESDRLSAARSRGLPDCPNVFVMEESDVADDIPLDARRQLNGQSHECSCYRGRTPRSWAALIFLHKPRSSLWEDGDPALVLIVAAWAPPVFWGVIALLGSLVQRPGLKGWVLWSAQACTEGLLLREGYRGRRWSTLDYVLWAVLKKCWIYFGLASIEAPYCWKNLSIWAGVSLGMVLKLPPILAVFHSQSLFRNIVRPRSMSMEEMSLIWGQFLAMLWGIIARSVLGHIIKMPR